MTRITPPLLKRTRVLVAIATASLVVGAGVTYAAIPSSNGVISACFSRSGGALRVVDADVKKCKQGEQLISWNQQGIAGQDGADGQDGAPGAAGTNGVSGYEIVTEDVLIEPGTGTIFSSTVVSCPSGKKALGGGIALLEDPDALVDTSALTTHSSYPSSDGSEWTVYFGLTSAFRFYAVRGYATCATMG